MGISALSTLSSRKTQAVQAQPHTQWHLPSYSKLAIGGVAQLIFEEQYYKLFFHFRMSNLAALKLAQFRQ